MYVAAQNGHVEALSVLISAGGNVNAAKKVSYSKDILTSKITVYDVTKSRATQQCRSHPHNHHYTTLYTSVVLSTVTLL